jgi:Family of unknown function (DUF5691)
MSARAFKARLLPALLAGTSRQLIDLAPLLQGAMAADDSKCDLKALALTAQALRFERPPPPSHYAAMVSRKPSRPSVPEAVRPLLVRLFGTPALVFSPDSDVALAMALALEAARLQPHPFDFARMERFMRAHADRLGPDVWQWVDRDRAADARRGYLDVEGLDDGNWHQATPARRQRYIADRRRRDADGVRGLFEAVWPNQTAETRLRLLQVLRSGLSAADAAFLQGLTKDRAPRVRELAERYLSRLPGATAQVAALKAFDGYLVRGQTGLLRKRPTLKLELPVTIKGDAWRDWVVQAVGDLELNELAAALDLRPGDIIVAAAQDHVLSAAVTLMAFRQGDPVVARQAFDAMPEALPWLTTSLLQAIEDIEPLARQELAEFLLRKTLSRESDSLSVLAQVHRLLEGPISDVLIEEILASPDWSRWSAGFDPCATFVPLAAVCPPASRAALREALSRIDSPGTQPVLQFLDILDSIEKVNPRE